MRAAAVSSLAKFGASVDSLKEKIVVLLKRALYDNDDEACPYFLNSIDAIFATSNVLLYNLKMVQCASVCPESTHLCIKVAAQSSLFLLTKCGPGHSGETANELNALLKRINSILTPYKRRRDIAAQNIYMSPKSFIDKIGSLKFEDITAPLDYR